MARINLILLAVVLLCALAVVSTNHRARKLVTGLEREQERMRALEVEWGQLQLEQSTWATHARIEQIARDKLGMHPPRANQIIAVDP
ncbi:MAG: cell division protein FtsL [Rhodocyclaceae bacterium]|nr:cell division protein FtsL [Rhodocyclaceae bacterium]